MRILGALTMAALTIFLAAPAAAGETTAASEDAVDTRATTETPPEPVLLFIQGKLKPGGEATYGKYIKGTGPLMAEFGVTVDAVGAGNTPPNPGRSTPSSASPIGRPQRLSWPTRATSRSRKNTAMRPTKNSI